LLILSLCHDKQVVLRIFISIFIVNGLYNGTHNYMYPRWPGQLF